MHEVFKGLGRELGGSIHTDEVGNTYVANTDEMGYTLIGSHLDSVIDGGRYDGVAGVIAGLMVMKWAKEDGLRIPLRVGAFRGVEQFRLLYDRKRTDHEGSLQAGYRTSDCEKRGDSGADLCQPRSEPSSETDLRCGALSGTPYRAGKGPRGISDGGRDRRHGRGTDPVPGVFERNGGTFRSDADGHEE